MTVLSPEEIAGGMKATFLSIMNEHVHRNGTDELVEWLEHSDFFYAPASTRFHGSYYGGLLEHSLNVYNRFRERVHGDKELYELAEEGVEGKCKFSEESIAIASLFHDACKINMYKEGFRNVKENGVWVSKKTYEIDEKFPAGYHADKSIILLQQFIKLEPEEILAIRAHMGAFDSAAKGGDQFISKIFERSRFAVHLHLADMEASYLIESRNT